VIKTPLLLALFTPKLLAQNQSLPQFEVATIKPVREKSEIKGEAMEIWEHM
jgi:hypothetical protein